MRPGNKNWGKNGPQTIEPSSFDEQVKKLGLKEDELVNSGPLRDWAIRNADLKYVPTALLKAWRIKVDT